MSKIFNVNESRELKFKLNVAGADPRDLSSRFNIKMNEMDISFPAKITNGFIIVDIPALDELLKKGLEEGNKYKANLEVIAESELKTPWNGEIQIKRPITIEATMEKAEEDIEEEKEFEVKVEDLIITEKKKPEKGVMIKEEEKKKKKLVFKNKKLADRLFKED